MKTNGITVLATDAGGVFTYDLYENFVADSAKGIRSIYPGLTEPFCAEACKALWGEYSVRSGEATVLEREYWNRFIVKAGLPSSATPDRFMAMTENFVRPIDGAMEILEELRSRRVMLAIVSNNTEFFFARQWESLGLSRFFEATNVVLSCRVGAPKSSPRYEMFTALVSAVGVPPAAIAFVDDRSTNCERAREFGILALRCGSAGLPGVRPDLVSLGLL